MKVGDLAVTGYAADEADAAAQKARFEGELKAALAKKNYPLGPAVEDDINRPMIVLLLCVLLSFGAITFSPTTTSLLEMFLPHPLHGDVVSLPPQRGVVRGLLPATAFTIVAATGKVYSGLYYPVAIAATCFVLSLLFARETKDLDISKG